MTTLQYHICPSCRHLFIWTRANKCRYCGAIYQQLRNDRRRNHFFAVPIRERQELMADLHSSGLSCYFCSNDIKGYKSDSANGHPACPYCYATYNYLQEIGPEARARLTGQKLVAVEDDEDLDVLLARAEAKAKEFSAEMNRINERGPVVPVEVEGGA